METAGNKISNKVERETSGEGFISNYVGLRVTMV